MTDERLEQTVATWLRAGVLLSAAVVSAGGIWWLAGASPGGAAYHHFHDAPPELRQVAALAKAVAHPRPEVVIQLGLLLLIGGSVLQPGASVWRGRSPAYDRITQNADAFDFDFHDVTGREPPGCARRAGEDEVSRKQRDPAADPAHDCRAIKDEVGRPLLLNRFAIEACLEPQIAVVEAGGEDRPDRPEGV